jgi:hypothetical protein
MEYQAVLTRERPGPRYRDVQFAAFESRCQLWNSGGDAARGVDGDIEP